MSKVGQIERKTQERVIKLLVDQLGYDFRGDWSYRDDNSNVEVELLTQNLHTRGYDDILINKAIARLKRSASLGGGRNLYEANRDVYGLLRYGVKVKAGVGEQNKTIELIDWKNPEANYLVLYVNGIAYNIKADHDCHNIFGGFGWPQGLLSVMRDVCATYLRDRSRRVSILGIRRNYSF